MSSNQVLGGHKANLNNPNSSEESKQNSRDVLESGDATSNADNQGDKNPNNVAGGYKATLSNPNAGDEAKQNAKEQLESMGKQ